MRALIPLLVLTFTLACGPAAPDDPCGIGVDPPAVGDGAARYRHDGTVVEFSGGGYKLEFPYDIVVGSLTLNSKQDRDSRMVADLIDTRRFPICVPLDAPDDGSGYALLEDGGSSFSTTASQTGMLTLIDLEGDVLSGRFAFDAIENGGQRVTRVEDGEFRLRPR